MRENYYIIGSKSSLMSKENKEIIQLINLAIGLLALDMLKEILQSVQGEMLQQLTRDGITEEHGAVYKLQQLAKDVQQSAKDVQQPAKDMLQSAKDVITQPVKDMLQSTKDVLQPVEGCTGADPGKDAGNVKKSS
jgi:hypothetical protein